VTTLRTKNVESYRTEHGTWKWGICVLSYLSKTSRKQNCPGFGKLFCDSDIDKKHVAEKNRNHVILSKNAKSDRTCKCPTL